MFHLLDTLNTWYFYNFAFCWSFQHVPWKSVSCLICVSSIYCACSLLFCYIFFCIKSMITILFLYFIFYSHYRLNRCSFKNILLCLSFSLSYTMNVNDSDSVITILPAYHVRNHIYVCVRVYAVCMCRYLVCFFSYLLAMLQEIYLSKIIYF